MVSYVVMALEHSFVRYLTGRGKRWNEPGHFAAKHTSLQEGCVLEAYTRKPKTGVKIPIRCFDFTRPEYSLLRVM